MEDPAAAQKLELVARLSSKHLLLPEPEDDVVSLREQAPCWRETLPAQMLGPYGEVLHMEPVTPTRCSPRAATRAAAPRGSLQWRPPAGALKAKAPAACDKPPASLPEAISQLRAMQTHRPAPPGGGSGHLGH